MKKWINLLPFAGVLLLPSCYCSKLVPVPSESHPRFLQSARSSYVRHMCFNGGNSMELSAYYGAPSYLKDQLSLQYQTTAMSNFKANSFGQFGFRFNRFMSPGFTRLAILRLGIDYSYSKNQLSWDQSYLGTATSTHLKFKSHRLLVNTSLYTFLTQYGLAGYLHLQGGVHFMNKSNSENSAFVFEDTFRSSNFDYRVGYGFQYFLSNDFSFFIEGGYGTGVYGKAGVSLSF